MTEFLHSLNSNASTHFDFKYMKLDEKVFDESNLNNETFARLEKLHHIVLEMFHQVLQDSLSVKKKQRRTSPNMFESLPAGNLGASSEVDNSKVIKKIEFGENSNSWADVGPLYIGTYCLDPLTITMKQRLLLQFLTPLAEYQEVCVFSSFLRRVIICC